VQVLHVRLLLKEVGSGEDPVEKWETLHEHLAEAESLVSDDSLGAIPTEVSTELTVVRKTFHDWVTVHELEVALRADRVEFAGEGHPLVVTSAGTRALDDAISIAQRLGYGSSSYEAQVLLSAAEHVRELRRAVLSMEWDKAGSVLAGIRSLSDLPAVAREEVDGAARHVDCRQAMASLCSVVSACNVPRRLGWSTCESRELFLAAFNTELLEDGVARLRGDVESEAIAGALDLADALVALRRLMADPAHREGEGA
jgi:hypothetical protein